MFSSPLQKKSLQEYALAIGIAVAVALTLRTYVIEAYRVPTEVMSPSLLPGDFVFAAKWPFVGGEPTVRHGQILIYRPSSDTRQSYIGRVVGLPGDRIEIRAGVVYWNDEELALLESRETASGTRCGLEAHPKGAYRVCIEDKFRETFETVTVGPGQVFLMTDHRSRIPERSRSLTALLPLENLKAEPRFIWLSIDPEAPGTFPKIRFARVFSRVR